MHNKTVAKRKKKKVYSKIKEPFIRTDKEISNPMEMLEEIFHIENIWSNYISSVIYKGNDTDVPYAYNLINILNEIKDDNLKTYIISFLMKIEDFNPFTDKVPIDKFPTNYKNMLIKIISILKKKNDKIEKLIEKQGFITLDNKKYSFLLQVNPQENINKELFKRGIDTTLIYKNKGIYVFSSNPSLINRPKVVFIFNKLDKMEPNVWTLYGNPYVFKTVKDNNSSILIDELLRIIKEQ